MEHSVWISPAKQNITVPHGGNLMEALRRAGFGVDAPCGGRGRCGKCKVLVDGKEELACRVMVDRDMAVALPQTPKETILIAGTAVQTGGEGYALAIDIGTTTVAACLMKDGQPLVRGSLPNSQRAFGADVIARVQSALAGNLDALKAAIDKCLEQLTHTLCEEAVVSPEKIATISIVGNPAMQQLFLGISPKNLAKIPFAPVLTKGQWVKAKGYLPLWETAELLIVPDISGFVGADTVACLLAADIEGEAAALLVDIGTNGEMVLCHRGKMVACSAAAGPALEGANIQFGMRAQDGAIDHVSWEKDKFICHVIGEGEALGICGSGLIDGVAAALDAGLINERGNILREDKRIHLTDTVFLTQEDIRQVQLAKGAIAAGIQMMQAHLGAEEIEKVYLAGAFGSFLDPRSSCRIGLLPGKWEEKVLPIGNAALSGAMILACEEAALQRAQRLTENIEVLELASLPGFQRCFAKNMRF